MPLTLVLETGAGLTNSNTYVSVAECDAYHDAQLRATDWTGASAGDKDKAVAMATRMIDAEMDFFGWKSKETQALQWPRALARNPDVYGGYIGVPIQTAGTYFDSATIPKALKDATCEFARVLLAEDRTRNPDSEGLKSVAIYQGISVVFDPATVQPVLHRIVTAMLSALGDPKDLHTRSVKLRRA